MQPARELGVTTYLVQSKDKVKQPVPLQVRDPFNVRYDPRARRRRREPRLSSQSKGNVWLLDYILIATICLVFPIASNTRIRVDDRY